jgi:hypothetical protein
MTVWHRPSQMRGIFIDSRVPPLAELKMKFQRIVAYENGADELFLVGRATLVWSRTCLRAFW